VRGSASLWEDGRVGGTPVVALQRIDAGARACVGLKLESLSLTGAAQDRLALALLEEGVRAGKLKPGGLVIEASTGNLAVSLAMACATLGYSFLAVMPESASPERRSLVQAYGARLELTPDRDHLAGALARAEVLGAQNPDAYLPRQFDNPITLQVYEETLGAELVATARTDGGADLLVGPVGTGGLLLGTACALRRAFPDVQVAAAVPEGQEGWSQNAPHHLQGVGVNLPLPLFEAATVDQVVPVSPHSAVQMQHRLAREEGLLVGFSTGLAVYAALGLARALPPSRRIYVLAADSGERYFSLQGYFP
jgi:cysteine synthase A